MNPERTGHRKEHGSSVLFFTECKINKKMYVVQETVIKFLFSVTFSPDAQLKFRKVKKNQISGKWLHIHSY